MPSSHAALSQLPSVTVPLALLIPRQKQHYFDTIGPRTPYRSRAFTFWGDAALFPLVHAFLNGCARDRDPDYRYVFDLLGTELAGNAVRHTRSGEPGGTFTLRVDRSAAGLTLTCRDGGLPDTHLRDRRDRARLQPNPAGLRADADATAGRGLALVDALATAWGDNGVPTYRHVWFHLAYDFAGSAWAAA
ncbi:ATP-binding protein [Streptomonospora wellingtoniae]|uniref:ATP-binding protein n=1 Tax=Streptomonospora wellingtoniae TaxID=3075544 RepID=A0ABU2KN36_9ACTN|nr:ATP-binding protein [Streptomonospora sp. DSM 45055]MDT0300680.1 ATP-binding protein [Streptomonospora sp. DSM 45055]